MTDAIEDMKTPETDRARALVLTGLGAVGLALITAQNFNLELGGVLPLLANRYYYVLIAIFLAAAFLTMPARRGGRIGPLDWIAAALTLGAAGWLAWNAERIITEGWEIVAPTDAALVSGLLVLLALEGVRRAGGWILFAICLLFGAYPLFADRLPGFLWGTQLTLAETVSAHAMGAESIIGIPLRVVADTLVGFIIFGTVLTRLGGGQFFMDLAVALMGRSRGGPAKVAVVSSALFGSLSGSVVSNLLTTGKLTIPTMQRAGYPATYAGAVEACASTGGTLMPPVMGAVAFIMASFLDTSYITIVTAAIVPSTLYYLALILQTDLYAARNGLRGLPEAEIPRMRRVLREGWPHLLSLTALVVLLFTVSPARAAYYATGLMIVLGLVLGHAPRSLSAMREIVVETTGNIANLVATLAGIGLVVGALSITGVGNAFSRELILYAGDSVFLLLVFGALTSFVLGMGMTVSACYVFLAAVLAPALTGLGLNAIAVHLFVLYWGMLSYITPPVALAAITAAQVSGGNGLATGLKAMRLGAVLFVLPFMFVYDPGLILIGAPLDVTISVATAIVATALLAAALEGYAPRLGVLRAADRGLIAVGALLLMVPDRMAEAAGILAVAFVVALRWRNLLMPGGVGAREAG